MEKSFITVRFAGITKEKRNFTVIFVGNMKYRYIAASIRMKKSEIIGRVMESNKKIRKSA